MSGVCLKNFLEIPYDELEELNLEAKDKLVRGTSGDDLKEYYLRYLHDEKRLKAVTICFTDIEGRFHMLDYDKKYLLKSHEQLTFDGSSIRGFAKVDQSDLRLEPEWGTFRWLPSDVFGPGKVIVFGLIKDRDGSLYESDMRSRLKNYIENLHKEKGLTTNISVECEGFLFDGLGAEQGYISHNGFSLVSNGGYFNSLPHDPLKLFIDGLAEAQRALGFENEKDHPEVAPSQFELNYKYCNALIAADLLQLYKLTARQIAANMGMTASFLPKPVQGINGSGMHCNVSLSKGDKNLFYDPAGEDSCSELGWNFIDRLLFSANEICLALNSSVNAYRRLDPAFEAPNQIKSSPIDRTSMIRIPLGNEQSARVEVRTVAPDANPYLVNLVLLQTGLDGPLDTSTATENRRTRTRFLPDNIYDAVRHFKGSDFISEIIGQESKEKFWARKLASADRCPRELGTIVKTEEILFHHEVTNQFLWSKF
ncbi:glutamine synthetase family protein [Oligoflexia bacterium]|nr:glutamine synthetase family protein [Oligoflexia bacterium]